MNRSRPYVWFEVNSARRESVDSYLSAAPAWEGVGQLIVSTTQDAGRAVYARLVDRHNITPGIKTASILKDLTDPTGWREVAKAAAAFADACHSNIVILENETAISEMLSAQAEPDYAAIGKAIADAGWDRRLTVWWYPSAAVAGDVARARMVRLAAVAMASLPKCRLVGIVPCPWHKGFSAMLDAQQQIDVIDPDNIPIAYLSDGYFANLPSAMAGVRGDVIVYPGLNNLSRAEGVRL